MCIKKKFTNLLQEILCQTVKFIGVFFILPLNRTYILTTSVSQALPAQGKTTELLQFKNLFTLLLKNMGKILAEM